MLVSTKLNAADPDKLTLGETVWSGSGRLGQALWQGIKEDPILHLDPIIEMYQDTLIGRMASMCRGRLTGRQRAHRRATHQRGHRR